MIFIGKVKDDYDRVFAVYEDDNGKMYYTEVLECPEDMIEKYYEQRIENEKGEVLF